MTILSIETSCDETSLAVVEANGGSEHPHFAVLAHNIASQIETHRPYGGVVPNLAKREHIANLPVLYKQICSSKYGAGSIKQNIDLVAVTVGPGLEPALWTGINFAEELVKKYNQPIVGVNHLEGHLFSFLLPKKTEATSSKQLAVSGMQFPAIALIVSGGHTILLLLGSLTSGKLLGETQDDAAGEAFDKVGRLLGLPYPGGPEIQKLAESGNSSAIEFPRPMINTKDYKFSFSGLKTAVLYYLRDTRCDSNARMHASGANNKSGNPDTYQENKKLFGPFEWSSGYSSRIRADIAASFQQAIIDVLVAKTMNAAKEYCAQSVILCGGVAANAALRERLAHESETRGFAFLVPKPVYNTDNAAMIAAAGYLTHLKGVKYPLAANGNLPMKVIQ